MVQVFGNRIIGGIGAPGGGMADAYATGVNTALNQKTSRQAMEERAQAMRLRDIELQWKTEDREEAKRRAAASAAAGAAANARNARIAEERLRILGGPGGAPAAATMTGTGGVRVPASTAVTAAGPVGMPVPGGPPAAATGAPPAGVRVPAPTPAPTLTYGSYTPAAAPGSEFSRLSNIEFVQGANPEAGVVVPGLAPTGLPSGAIWFSVPSAHGSDAVSAEFRRNRMARPWTYQAEANLERLAAAGAAEPPPAFERVTVPNGIARGVSGEYLYNRTTGEVQTLDGTPIPGRLGLAIKGAIDTTLQTAGGSASQSFAAAQELTARSQEALARGDVAEATALAEQARQYREQARVQLNEPRVRTDRGITALEGPDATGAADALMRQAAAQRAEQAAEQATEQATELGKQRVALAEQSAMDSSAGNLSFGPQLGATPATTEQVAIDNFVASTGVDPYAPPPPAPPPMREPGAPNRAVAGLLSKRDQQVQLIELYTKEGLYGEADALMLELANTDIQLEAAASRLALQEATMFNAPQRLGVVWSGIYNREVEFRPTAEGGFDMLVDGELIQANMDPATLEQETLMMTDAAFAEQQAALANMTAEALAKGRGEGQAAVETAALGLPVKEAEADIAANRDIAVAEAQAALDVQKQQVLSDIATAQDMGVKMNDVQKQQLEFILRQQGKLPAEARELQYIEGDDGSIAIFDGARRVAYFVRGETTNTAGVLVPTLQEVRE